MMSSGLSLSLDVDFKFILESMQYKLWAEFEKPGHLGSREGLETLGTKKSGFLCFWSPNLMKVHF